jgi:hypothetical protein
MEGWRVDLGYPEDQEPTDELFGEANASTVSTTADTTTTGTED